MLCNGLLIYISMPINIYTTAEKLLMTVFLSVGDKSIKREPPRMDILRIVPVIGGHNQATST